MHQKTLDHIGSVFARTAIEPMFLSSPAQLISTLTSGTRNKLRQKKLSNKGEAPTFQGWHRLYF
jgi:hypothetical protein